MKAEDAALLTADPWNEAFKDADVAEKKDTLTDLPEKDSTVLIENEDMVLIGDKEWECLLCSIYIVGEANVKVIFSSPLPATVNDLSQT